MASQIIGPSGAPPTQPVTGPLTDTQLRASPVPVSGTVTATTGGLTDTQLRASAVPMTGSGAAGTAAAGVVTVQGIASMTKLLVTPDSVALPANQSVNVSQVNGATVNVGAGNASTGTARVSISTDDVNLAAINAVSGTTAGAKVITDANGTIQQYLRGIIYQLITAGASFFTATPGTTGGWSIFNATSGDGSTALTNSAQAVKTSQGTLGGWYIYNPNTAVSYVPIYNVTAASVTVGTTNPAMVLAIPSLGAANIEIVNGLQFSTAISVAAATTAAGAGAPSVALEANFWYK